MSAAVSCPIAYIYLLLHQFYCRQSFTVIAHLVIRTGQEKKLQRRQVLACVQSGLKHFDYFMLLLFLCIAGQLNFVEKGKSGKKKDKNNKIR